jgi:type IV secretion system protein VirD4
MQLEEREDGDRDRLDLAVDDLGGLEDQLKQREEVSG